MFTPYLLRPRDVHVCSEMLCQAFRRDQLWQALLQGIPAPQQRGRALFRTLLRYCLRYGTVVATSPLLEAVALTVPGSHTQVGLWQLVRSGGLYTSIKMGSVLRQRIGTLFSDVDAYRERYMAGQEYTYLEILGTQPHLWGQGHGGTLLRHLLERAAQRGHPLYLETETAQNVAFYAHFGFTVVTSWCLPEVHHPLWAMVKAPLPQKVIPR